MKVNATTLSLLLLGCAIWNCLGASVPARFVNLSVQVQPAVERDRLTRLDHRMSVSAFRSSANNEFPFATAQDAQFRHQGFFQLEDPTTLETIPFPFGMDLPFDDPNGSGFPDFFEPSAAVENLTIIGLHSDGFGGAVEFTATWNRAAGSASGTVVIDMPFFGRRFTHQMSLLAYQGSYDFTRAGTNLTGSVTLTNMTEAADVISGGFNAGIANTNVLSYSPTTWRNGDLSYPIVPVDPLERSRSNYVTIVVFTDGFPATGEEDFPVYLLSLSSADANGNGVPDLVENETVSPAARPTLSIERVAESVRIRVQGTPGKTYALESASDVNATAWTREQAIAMGSETTAQVTLPATGARRFFRLIEE